MHKSLKLFLFLVLIAIATPSFAQIHLGINFGPPARRIEVRGRAPSRTSVWIGGFYTFNTSRDDYDWNRGRWEERPSPRSRWDAPRYRAHNDHYDYYEGGWNDHGRDDHRGESHGGDDHGGDNHGGDNHGRGDHGRGDHGRGDHGRDEHGGGDHGRDH